MSVDLLPAYLRQPTVAGETLVFVCDDDLWRCSAAGGVATRLTAGAGEPSSPALSPDGRWLAYTGRDEQHAEVWLMPAAGGPSRRLTWLGSDAHVRGWLPDGRILYVSAHGQPFMRHLHAWAVAPEGGPPQALGLGAVNHLAIGGDGRRAVGRNTEDPARWKRYRGGRAGHLWVDADGSGRFQRLRQLPGNLSCPMWIGHRLWFLSDGEGIANLYSCEADGSGLQRHTDHADHFARHAQSDGRRIVYACAAELWCLDTAEGVTRRLDIRVPAARSQCARRFVPAADHLQGMALHPQGHSVALEVRGQAFTMPLWEGAATRHGTQGRRRLGQWLGDGSGFVAVCDASGEERIVVDQRELPWDPGHVSELRAAPVGTRLAFANHRQELWLGDAADGSLQCVDRSDSGRIHDLAWSPCGGWLAYAFDTSPRHKAIKLLDVAAGRTLFATEPQFRDWSPSFDPEGRYLYFLSLRTFDPVYDNLQFEMSFPRAARPYLLALQAGGRPPFEPVPRGLAPDEPPRPPAAKAPLVVHEEGLARRIAAFPVPEARFGQLAGLAGGRVAWTVLPIPGAHGRGGHKEVPGRLELFDVASGKLRPLLDKADAFAVAADGHTVLVREGGTLRAVSAASARRADEKDKPADDRPSRDSGLLDLGRLRVAVDPPAEWRQMLREVWRLQRHQFWVEDMSGVDWPAMWERYAALLPRVATRGELSDLVWELQGELGTSHAYEMGGDHRKPPPLAMGFLAAELAPAADGWAITRIVQGDPWDAAADSPLNAVGVEARVGDRIVAIGGQAVGPAEPPAALLVHQAGRKVALTLAGEAGTREVLVTLLADETPALYREWVQRQRAWVHAHSGGRVGYLHVPDMMAAGFAEFHRHYAEESDRDALLVDVRFNRGGHVSQLLLEKLARRRIAWNLQRWGRPEPYPDAAPAGPVVALTNEHAGSDGDIFSHNFKQMGLGPLVGVRTWGGVIGIWPRHALADGSTVTQPEYSFWFRDVGWGVENFGTEPTIEVDLAPGEAGDRQLEVALATVLARIDREGVSRPAFGPRPRLAPPPLPPRT